MTSTVKAQQIREWKQANPDRVREHTRRFHEKNPGYKARATERQRELHPQKHRARAVVRQAVYTGRLVKPDNCEGCNAEIENPRDLHAHHRDYNEPYDVEWLCRSCHWGRH